MVQVIYDLIAGTVGGCTGIALGHPLDTVKVRLQSQGMLYKGAMDCVYQTFRQEGLRGFFKGLMPPLVSNFPLNGALFMSYGAAERYLNPPSNRRPSTYQEITLAGFAGGLVTSFVACPAELIKCQIQNHVEVKGGSSTPNPRPVAQLRKVMAANGPLLGPYRGLTATLIRDTPTYGLYFYTYERVKTLLREGWPEIFSRDQILAPLVAGGFAGQITWFASYPADVVKSVIQTAPLTAKYNDVRFSVVARDIYRQHGGAYFFRGIGVVLVRAFPVNAVTLTVYEGILTFFEEEDSHPLYPL